MFKRKKFIVFLLLLTLVLSSLPIVEGNVYGEEAIRWYEVDSYENLETAIRFTNMKYIKIKKDIMMVKPINITRDMVIVGDEGGDSRVKLKTYNTIHFTVKEGANVEFKNLDFLNDHTSIDIGGQHGGIDNNGELSIDSCNFIRNQGRLGGAIYNKGILNVKDSLFKENLSYDGGAIKNRRELNLYGKNDFIGNSSLVFGGAISNIYKEAGEVAEGSLNKSSHPLRDLRNEGEQNSIINLYGDTNFINNEGYSGGAIGGDLQKNNNKIINFKDDSTTVFEKNRAYFEEDDGTKNWGEGGAIYNNEINGDADSYIEFKGNKAKTGGAIALTHSEQNININSSRGVVFEDNEIEILEDAPKPPSAIRLKENDGVDIAISNRNSLNIGYGSFKDKKYDKKSNIYISTESQVHGDAKPGDNELILKNSQIDVLGNFIVFDKSLDEEFKIRLDESRLETMSSLVARLPESGDIGSGSLNIDIDKSNIFVENLELALGDVKDRTSTRIVNNTIEAEGLDLNTRGELLHNTIRSSKMKFDQGLSLKNNLIIGSIEGDIKSLLGKASKLEGNDGLEDILYVKDDSRNIYTDSSSEILSDTKDPYLKIGGLKELGNEDDLKKLEHYRPLGDSLAKGFKRVEEVDLDAVSKPRGGEGQDDVTMGSIEGGYSKKVVVEFDANGGLIDSLAREDIRVTKGTTLTQLDLESHIPVRDGYKFLGWFLDRDSKEEFDSQKVIDNFTVLYAGWEREVYKMKLDGNGGSFKNDEKIIEVTKEDELKEPSRVGYKFLGWSENQYSEDGKSLKSTEDLKKELESLNENKSYYAIWEAYTMTLEGNGGSFLYGESVNLNIGQNIVEPVREGYKFLGWSTSENDQVEKTSDELQTTLDSLDEDLTYYGVWQKNPTLSLNANGGRFKDNSGLSILSNGDKVEEPVREGYKFLGWSTSKDGNVEKTSDELKTILDSLNEDLTYYGVWEKDPVLTLLANGGNFSDKNLGLNLRPGARIEEPQREGYVFMGWSRSYDGGVEKTSEELQKILNNLEDNETYYGVWREDKVLKLDGNGGNFDRDRTSLELSKGDKLEEPSREGYVFLGWSRSKAGKVEKTSDELQTILDSLEEDLTYYGVWEKKVSPPTDPVEDYRLVLDGNGGNFDRGRTSLELSRGDKVEEPSREGYIFLGWSRSKAGKVEKTSDEVQTILDSLEEDLTYYGVWEKKVSPPTDPVEDYSLVLDGNGGNFDRDRTSLELSRGDKLEEPSREGYIFLGWSRSKDGKVEKTSDELQTILDSLEEDLTYYGVWEKKVSPPTDPVEDYSLVLDGNGGNFDRDRTSLELSRGDKLEEPSREGYIFLGWSRSKAGKVEKTSDELQTILDSLEEDLTYYGVWEKAILDKENHLAYIKGYSDNTIRPKSKITREEVAMVFYRLLDQDKKDEIYSENNGFSDVDKKRWSNTAISSLTNGGILVGYPNNSFKPGGEITRGEVTAIIARFGNLETASPRFTDIDNHWSREYIISASEKGWIQGYEDGSFKPDDPITRGEFVTIVNNILERKVREENILDGTIKFKDLNRNSWYYEAMVEASNSHSYKKERLEDGSEVWLELIENNL